MNPLILPVSLDRSADIGAPSPNLLLVLYAGALSTLALLSLCVFGDVDLSAALPTAVLIGLTGLPAITALTLRGYDIFSPFQLVAAYFLVYYAVRAEYLQLNTRALR